MCRFYVGLVVCIHGRITFDCDLGRRRVPLLAPLLLLLLLPLHAGVVERDGIAGSIITGAVAGRLEIGLARCIDHPRRRRRRGEMHFNNH